MSYQFTFTTQSERRLIPAGTYPATFERFMPKEGRVGFQFLVEGQGSAWQWISTVPSAEGVLRSTLEAIGFAAPDGAGQADFDPDACKGQPVLVTVTHNEFNGQTRDNVTRVQVRSTADDESDDQ